MSAEAITYLEQQRRASRSQKTPFEQLHLALLDALADWRQVFGYTQSVNTLQLEGVAYILVGRHPQNLKRLAFRIDDIYPLGELTFIRYQEVDTPLVGVSLIDGGVQGAIPIRFTSEGLVGENEDLSLSLVRVLYTHAIAQEVGINGGVR